MIPMLKRFIKKDENEVKNIDIALSDDVASGNICCLKCGKIVIVEVSDIVLKTDKSEWSTMIATGLPPYNNKYNTWNKGILLENKGHVNVYENGQLYVCERTGTQKASSCYIGQLIYMTK